MKKILFVLCALLLVPDVYKRQVLVPTATGIDHSDKTAGTENEEIVLMK